MFCTSACLQMNMCKYSVLNYETVDYILTQPVSDPDFCLAQPLRPPPIARV
jgi:hypothetical protein